MKLTNDLSRPNGLVFFWGTCRCWRNRIHTSRYWKLIVGVVFLVAVIVYSTQPAVIKAHKWPQNMSSMWTHLKGESKAPAPSCNRTWKFSRVRLPVTALASAQGSGNTWMRHILQQLTGIYTGSKYGWSKDPELWAQGYYGEGIYNGSVIAVKTHGQPESKYGFKRVILIIRNPFDAMFADFNRRATASHTGIASARSYIEHWKNFSTTYGSRWARFNLAWLSYKKPLLLINFDDLVHSLETQVNKIAAFIHHPSIHFDVDCVLRNPKGNSKRKKSTFSKEEVFSDDEIRITNKYIRLLQKILKKKFPKVSQDIGAWIHSENTTQLIWKSVRKKIT